MIKTTLIIDITDMINVEKPFELNYKEKSYNLTGDNKETINFALRTIIDRRYNQKFNKHQDFYKKIFIIEKYNNPNRTRVTPVYPAEEFRLLALSVGGRDNLKLGRLVGAYNKLYTRDIVEIYYYTN